METENYKTIKIFGRVTASMTHELKNVLAIIQESAGLIEDILFLGNGDYPGKKDKLEAATSKIKHQVSRGSKLLTYLNRFVHLPDQPVAEVELTEVLELMTALVQRLASLKNIEVKWEAPASKSLRVRTRPLEMVNMLFQVIDLFIDLLGPESQIVLGAFKEDEWVRLAFNWNSNNISAEELVREIETSEKWVEVGQIIDKMNGKKMLEQESGSVSLLIRDLK